MSLIRIAAVVRRHWLVLWRGPHRWFEIAFWPVMDVILWGSLGLYLARAAGSASHGAATAATFLLAGIMLFWTLTVVQMTMSISLMDETNTRNLLNVLTTSVTPAEYLMGVAAFGLIKLSLTMVTLTLVTLGVYGFSLASIGWATVPIVLVLIVTGWAVGFIVLGLIMRFGPSAEILTWGINYVMLSLSGVSTRYLQPHQERPVTLSRFESHRRRRTRGRSASRSSRRRVRSTSARIVAAGGVANAASNAQVKAAHVGPVSRRVSAAM